MTPLMYTIQQHKAKAHILNTLPCDPISIQHKNGIPKIGYTSNTCFTTFGSKHYRQVDNNHTEFIETLYKTTLTHLRKVLANVLNIYGIHNTYHLNSGYIHITTIQYDLGVILIGSLVDNTEFIVIESPNIEQFQITMLNDNNIDEPGFLLFLIDPLQAIDKMQNKPKNPTIQHFFEYYRDAITKQDRDLLIKYLLASHLVRKYMIPDIMVIIMSDVIGLLLL